MEPMRLPDDLDLAALEERITDFYHTLGDVADGLSLWTMAEDDEPTREYLDNLEWRMPLDAVRCYILAARHELHGAMTEMVKYQGRTSLSRRPTDGDPSNASPANPDG